MAIAAAQSENSNVIVVTGTTAVADDITDSDVIIQAIHWHKPTTNGHLLSLTDKAGNGLLKMSQATTSVNEDKTITFPHGLRAKGIYSDDMDSGTLYIYLK